MNMIYQLEKALWTDADFDQMSWHDCPIKGLAFNNHQLMLDIDYIFKWVLMKNKKRYMFWISPCTLVFDYVHAIELSSDYARLTIDNISRETGVASTNAEQMDRPVEFDWSIQTTVGELSFKSTGYKQFVRQHPRLVTAQELNTVTRGGISFSTVNVDLITSTMPAEP